MTRRVRLRTGSASALLSQLQQPSAGGTYREMSPADQRSSAAPHQEDQPTENCTVGTHTGGDDWGTQTVCGEVLLLLNPGAGQPSEMLFLLKRWEVIHEIR